MADKLASDDRKSRVRIFSIFIFLIALLVSEIYIKQLFGAMNTFSHYFESIKIFGFNFNKNLLANSVPIEALSVIVFSPLAIKIIKKYKIESGNYIFIGLFFILLSAISFLLIDSVLIYKKISFSWLIPSYFLMGIGELFIFPLVFSRVYSWSKDSWKGVMMGVLYFFAGAGSFISSLIGINSFDFDKKQKLFYIKHYFKVYQFQYS